jgi:hypothetical protein
MMKIGLRRRMRTKSTDKESDKANKEKPENETKVITKRTV